MGNELNQLRTGFTHGTVKGDGAEELVRAFLRKQLPASVGITSGQALDSTGATSAQLDVIVYDAIRTPMLFESPREGQHLVPAEGVIAAVEVKSHLKKSHLQGILDNGRSVKALQKVAYFPTPITSTRYIYGKQWVDIPVHYSVSHLRATTCTPGSSMIFKQKSLLMAESTRSATSIAVST